MRANGTSKKHFVYVVNNSAVVDYHMRKKNWRKTVLENQHSMELVKLLSSILRSIKSCVLKSWQTSDVCLYRYALEQTFISCMKVSDFQNLLKPAAERLCIRIHFVLDEIKSEKFSMRGCGSWTSLPFISFSSLNELEEVSPYRTNI